MPFFPKTATALALVFALAACGGGSDEADDAAAPATQATVTTTPPAATATPAAGETPTPGATPSDAATPTPTATPSASLTRATPTPTPVAAAGPPQVFNQCTACHSVKRGENGLGPSLAGVFGRRAGTLPGFEYSAAMKGAGLTWNQGNLDRYLENPRGVVPGTTMAYNGVKDAAQRTALINYLKTL